MRAARLIPLESVMLCGGPRVGAVMRAARLIPLESVMLCGGPRERAL